MDGRRMILVSAMKSGTIKNHEDCYPQNNVCNEECEEIRNELNSKFAEMNKNKPYYMK